MRAEKFDELRRRFNYLCDIKGDDLPAYLENLKGAFFSLESGWESLRGADLDSQLGNLESKVSEAEKIMSEEPRTPMEIVRISRHPDRISLHDILTFCYDSFEVISGEDLKDPDPAVVVARAIIQRRKGRSLLGDRVMVIGHESGHGQDERSGGAANQFGNQKIAHFIRRAEREQTPVHLWASTPGTKALEEYPGAAQSISRAIRVATSARIPIVVVNYGQGGSGGFEAAGVGNIRLMTSHAWYSAISPEGAAAIEALQLPPEERTDDKIKELIEQCAANLRITARDCLRFGIIDGIIEEPPLGARSGDIEFFRRARYDVIKATDEIVLRARSERKLRNYLRKQGSFEETDGKFYVYVPWELSRKELEKVVRDRRDKERRLSKGFYLDRRSESDLTRQRRTDRIMRLKNAVRKGVFKPTRRIIIAAGDIGDAISARAGDPYLSSTIISVPRRFGMREDIRSSIQKLEEKYPVDESYVSPLAKIDKSVKCPKREEKGCLDVWAPDLYNEFAGICPNCGYHFEMEWQYLLAKWFNKGSVHEFNDGIIETNVVGFPGVNERLERARRKSGKNSSVLTFEAKLYGIKLIGAMLIGDFWGGSVGIGGSEKICLAIERAMKNKMPFLFISHKTVGIRTQESAVGLQAMEQVSSVLEEYMEKGGLPVSIFAGTTYAGPYASFLSMPNNIYALPSIKVGFAGPDVIYRTTRIRVSPNYHDVEEAKQRGHITGLWRRDMVRPNLYRILVFGEGKNLYYM